MIVWRDEFYLPVAQNSFNSLREGGVMMVNILDPKVKGKRYRSGDELVDMLRPHFMGQVGMRIMQRPQGKVFSLMRMVISTRDFWMSL